MTQEPVLEQWVIYDKPRDYPDAFVVRCWQVFRGGELAVTAEVWLRPTLEEARAVIEANYPDGFRLDRSPDDDPAIAEVWT